MITLNLILIFISIGSLAYSLLTLLFIKKRLSVRIEGYFSVLNKEDEENKEKVRIDFRRVIKNLGKRINDMGLLKSYINKIQKELIKAGIPLKGEEFLSIQILIISILGLLVLNIVKSIPLFLIICILGWMIPRQFIKMRKNKKNKLFNDQLGDAIVLISNSLKAGHSFLQAVDSVASEMPDPTAHEFKKMLREMTLGVSTEEALINLLDRVESDDLELVVTAVIIQRQIGGNLSQILDNISGTIRERVKIKGEVKTLTAQGRMSGIIVSALPFGLGAILYFMNPEYISTLFSNPIGLSITGMAIFSQTLGMIMISKIVKIEV